MPWKWDALEALAFELLREQATKAVTMHGHAFDLPVEMYSDASGFGGGCVIVQVRDKIPYPILYDSFLFTKTQRNYSTYKRELCAVVEFCRRHRYYFQSILTSVIFTDHKLLTWFLTSTNHEGIYARWVTELRTLNVTIQYITGRRNAAADRLSRTIFVSPECESDPSLADLGTVDTDGT